MHLQAKSRSVSDTSLNQSHLAVRGGRIFSAYFFRYNCLLHISINYTENVTDLYAHAQTVDTRRSSPIFQAPGYEANGIPAHYRVVLMERLGGLFFDGGRSCVGDFFRWSFRSVPLRVSRGEYTFFCVTVYSVDIFSTALVLLVKENILQEVNTCGSRSGNQAECPSVAKGVADTRNTTIFLSPYVLCFTTETSDCHALAVTVPHSSQLFCILDQFRSVI